MTSMTIAMNIAYRRQVALLLPAVMAAAFLMLSGPIPQDPAYHLFADRRSLLGVPNFGDTVTNLPFIVLGVLGTILFHRRDSVPRIVSTNGERVRLETFFIGVFLTGLGSVIYHLSPGNGTIILDRLPMTVTFMSLFAVVIGERISLRAASVSLAPLLAGGVASVLWWAVTQSQGRGDLRWYGVVQYYPMLAIPLMLIFLPGRYRNAGAYGGLLLGYGGGKIFELLDRPVFRLIGFVSGHSLKHLLAAAGIWWFWVTLRRGLPRAGGP